MRVLFVSAEAVPFAKVGGLADVVGALPQALAKLGVEARIIIPKYKSIDARYVIARAPDIAPLTINMGTRVELAEIYLSKLPQCDLTVLFIANERYFGRDGIYDDPKTKEGYPDNGERFAFFSRAALEAIKALNWKPDIVHVHDHQTALIPAYLKLGYASDPFFKGVATVLTIHNIAYQGVYDKELMRAAGFDENLFYPMSPFEFYGKLNMMKVGIHYADIINTVSEKYAEEIQSSEEFGCGLQGVLRQRSLDLYGILNGVDYSVWNPETDPYIPYNYGPYNLEDKHKDKIFLLSETNLPHLPADPPLIGMISRLADQKGFDLVAEKIDQILALDLQMILLGTGQQRYHELFEEIARRHPDKISVNLRFDDRLAHLIEAGCDMFLMPSRYEPCGLNQMYSLKYGTVPIVRATGGLADTIQEFDPSTGRGNGFRFYSYSSDEMLAAIKRALSIYRDGELWRRLQLNGMRADYSWETSARKYVSLYRKALAKAGRN